MNRFNRVLMDTDARLSVSEPARSRILLEIAADMEGLHREFLSRGLSPEDADAEVLEHFDLSDEALRELIRVHDTPLQRSLETLSGPVEGKWSRLLLGVLALFVVVGSGTLLVNTQLYRDASGLVWVLMPLLLLGWLMAALRGLQMARQRDSWSHALRVGLSRLLGLALAIPALAFVGLWIELYRGILRIRATPAEAMVHIVDWLHMASATLTVALGGSLILGFLWFFLDSRARRMERRAAADLLGGAA